MAKVPQVVIIGAGFGGTYTARFLKRAVRRGEINLTIINRTNYFLFTPLLHEVATGGLSATSVAEPLREIFRGSGITIRETVVTGIDPARRVVVTKDGEVAYDYLVISAGAETDFHNVPGARNYGLVLKNLFDAVTIRDRVVENFERAAATDDLSLRKKLLSFVVVGGGATGVELAAELAELIYDTLCPYYGRAGKSCRAATIILVSNDDELLKQFPSTLRQTAEKILISKGVKLKLGRAVTEVTAEQVMTDGAPPLPAALVLWAAGVKPTSLNLPGAARQPGGRLMVNQFLQAVGFEQIFVVGDLAAVGENSSGSFLPMLAQVAVREAKVTAGNIFAAATGRPLYPFRYRSKGSLVSLGRWYAVGEIFGWPIRGRLAWLIWRAVYLFKFHSWRKRLLIAVEWTINFFSSRDITKVR